MVARNTGRPVSGPYKKEGRLPDTPQGWPHVAARIHQQVHSALIPNICIQTSHKGPNSSLFERTPSLPPCGADSLCQGADSPCQGEMAEGQKG